MRTRAQDEEPDAVSRPDSSRSDAAEPAESAAVETPTKATATEPPVTAGWSKSKRELVAALLAIVVGLPLIVSLGLALTDAVRRSREAPLRSILGDTRYDELGARRRRLSPLSRP